ncbi:MAG TPA: efflux transporter outer membrane subunit [Nevskiaceae bacterium]
MIRFPGSPSGSSATRHAARYAFAALAAVALAGCTVGPNFHPPAAPPQANYLATGPLTSTSAAAGAANGQAQRFVRGAELQRDWYRLYHNAALNHLIDEALAANPTRAAAEQRLAAARDAVRVMFGGRYPSLSGSAGASRQRLTGIPLGLANPEFSNTFNLFDLQLTAAYNLDIFGELTRRIENQQALEAAAHARVLDTTATLVDNVVATALAEAAARTTLHGLREIIDQQRQTLALVKTQERLGTALQSAVLQAQTQLANTEALIPDLEQQISVARHRMAILTGLPPSDYHGPEFVLDDFALPQDLPLTLPARLVDQRPDVLMARDLLHAASAEVGVATAEQLPQLQITAGYGRDALKISTFNSPPAKQFNLGIGLLAPIFEGGSLRANKQRAVDNYNAAAEDYRATVLNAFDQVADAMRALQHDATRLAARHRARQAAEATAQLVLAQFRAGAADQLANRAAQVDLRRAEISYADARLARLVDTATLMRALGGGWWPKADEPPPEGLTTTPLAQPIPIKTPSP